MKKFKHVTLLLLAVVVVFGCSKYDDTDLRNDVSDLQSRVEKLEKWCTTANSQISALQGLVEALQANDYITGVVPIMDGTKEIGYSINFKKGQSITIMNGKDGINGTTPLIGVAKADDGLYYWTVQTGTAEATWLTDAEGNKIRTTGDKGSDGTIGKDGVTPKLSIEKDGDTYYWKVNSEWMLDAESKKVPATGAKGDTGATGPSGSNGADGAKGDSFFKSVTSYPDKGYVEFEPTVGAKFQLPLLSTTVSFDKYEPMQIAATNTETAVKVTLPLTLKKATFAAIKADITNVAGTNSAITRAAVKWDVAVTAPTFKADGTLDAQPTVKVTIPATATEGETALLKVTVVDNQGNESASTRVLYYSNKVPVTSITLTNDTISIGDKKTLTATIAPSNATIQTVTWSSSDAAIATVNATTGEVEGKSKGEVTITATATDGSGVTGTCKVTVPLKWAAGNLVADGANGAKIGTATDGGLYFQFGSLVGWSTTGSPKVTVRPVGCTVTSWNSSWTGDPTTDDAVSGKGDPCRYYLKGTWRLPTNDEYKALFNNVTDSSYANSGGWSWDATSNSATNNTKNLTFPASGSRLVSDGSLSSVGTYGYYWSASPIYGSNGYLLYFYNSDVYPSINDTQARGLPVRCVQNASN